MSEQYPDIPVTLDHLKIEREGLVETQDDFYQQRLALVLSLEEETFTAEKLSETRDRIAKTERAIKSIYSAILDTDKEIEHASA